jgi:hypothetical protein
MMTLLVGELELVEATPRLRGIVVRNGGFEVFAQRRRLRQLATQPPQETDGVRAVAHSFFT